MNSEVTLIAIVFAIWAVVSDVCYAKARDTFDAYKRMRDDRPIFFKVFGVYKKHLGNQDEWVRRYRVLVTLFFVTGLLWCAGVFVSMQK